jgi:hypothetical protein
MPVWLTVTAIVLPGPTAVGNADASTARTLDEEPVPLDVAGELPPGAFIEVLLLVPLLLPPLPPPPQPARLSPSAAAMIHAILRTFILSIDF